MVPRTISTFLEVGCGTGFVLMGIQNAFPHISLDATEFHPEGLAFARQRVPSCNFRIEDARQLSKTCNYDCLGSFDVLEHIDDDMLVLRNFFDVLKPGGYILLTVPQHPWLWSSTDVHAHHLRRYTRSELIRKVKLAHFSVEFCTSFVSLLLPLMMISRLSSQQKPYNVSDEFKIHPCLNSLFLCVMRLEFLLLRLGVRFPYGGSLILLARKL